MIEVNQEIEQFIYGNDSESLDELEDRFPKTIMPWEQGSLTKDLRMAGTRVASWIRDPATGVNCVNWAQSHHISMRWLVLNDIDDDCLSPLDVNNDAHGAAYS